jgi:transmembrane sensor
MDISLLITLLSRKMAGEATQEELAQLRLLMEQYPDSIYYDEILQELWADTHDTNYQVPNVDDQYRQHLLRYSDNFTPSPTESLTAKALSYLGIACLALGVIVSSLFLINFWHKEIPLAYHPVEVTASKGIRKKILLPDGTLVWLNAGSKLSYNNDLGKQKLRKVFLSGEAFFDVAHRKSQPFIVNTEQISVKVLGTAFNIQAYPEDRKSEATLLRGSIELSVNAQSAEKVILNPSEKFAFSSEKKTMVINHVEPVKIGKEEYIEETSWKDNQLVFNNESLQELRPKLERWFNIQISIRSEEPKNYRFTGVFKNERIDEALAAMQLIKPFTFKLTRYDVIIY